MAKGIIDAIYWRFHTAFLRNEREQAVAALGMIEDEADDEAIETEIGPHFERFLRMRVSVRKGNFGWLYGNGTTSPSGTWVQPLETDVLEREFNAMLMSSAVLPVFLGALGVGPDAIMAYEVDMAPYGRCDFLLRDGRTWHVVEVKMGEAKAALIGQVGQYRTAMELDMCMGLHDRVAIHVLAGSFSPYVAAELARLDVGMFLHDGTPKGIRPLCGNPDNNPDKVSGLGLEASGGRT